MSAARATTAKRKTAAKSKAVAKRKTELKKPRSEVLVEVRGLKMYFPVTEGALIPRVVAHVKAVDGISFNIMRGETLGLVGESGCGKTTTGRCILQLEKATAGDIIYDGVNLNELNQKELRPLRQRIQVIFQDPFSSLNPRMKIGEIISEPMLVHKTEPDKAAAERLFAEAIAIGREEGSVCWELRSGICLARLWLTEGKPEEAQNLLKPIYARFTEGFGSHDLIQARGILERISKELGKDQ